MASTSPRNHHRASAHAASLRFHFLVVLGVACLAAPSEVRACSLGYCDPPLAYPETDTLPIDLARVFLHPGRYGNVAPSAPDVVLSYAPPGSDVFTQVPVDVQDVPDETRPRFSVGTDAPITVGGRLRLEAANLCAGPTNPIVRVVVGEWTLGAAMEAPTTLGTTQVSPPIRETVQLAGGSACSYEAVRTYVEVSLDLDPAAEAFRDRMHFTTWADGVLHVSSTDYADQSTLSSSDAVRGGSAHGRGVDRLLVLCDADDGTGYAPGHHTVQFRAALPDGTALASAPIVWELRCGGGESNCGVGALAASEPNPHGAFGVGLGLVALVLARVRTARRRRRGCPTERARRTHP